ncbi:MAG: hypothetical protein JSU86_20070 [Phycisphaerales bacterium]|nr:MAG: hypothetical protein JSU86_20070 [Phycisphaerales bacterium]
MARGQLQGIGSVTVWMIVFVALWLTSTVFLVILYTGQEGLRSENTRLTEDNLRLISSAERNSVPLFKNAAKGGPTVVGLLEEARGETARLATGEAVGDAGTVRDQLEGILRIIRSDRIVPEPESYQDFSYHEALTMLYEAFSAEHTLRSDAEQRVAELEANTDELLAANKQQSDNFDKRAKELGDQLADAEKDRDRYRKERDDEVADLERRFAERDKQSDADLTRERQRSAALEDRVAQCQERVAALQGKLGGQMIGPPELSTARQPDGTILGAPPGDDVVFIDLGRKDRLVLGLKFAVYSPQSGIPADGRAKAQIEVVAIDTMSAECKIVGIAPDEVILQGDLIANPVYDRDHPISFVVAGGFDLNHDGTIDANGAAAIEAMIIDWGGTLSSELTALTDFVVLGRAPRRPRSAAEGSSDQARRAAVEKRAYDRYTETIEAADTLRVPVLTQEVFLNFLGYSGRHTRP